MILAAAAPAAAQTEDASSAPSALHVAIPSFLPQESANDAAAPAAPLNLAAQSPTTHSMGGKELFFRVEGGLIFCCSNTGFAVGLAVSGVPQALPNVEIMGDFAYGRLAGGNFLSFSGNGLYDFHLQGHDIVPYAGAGIGIAHVGFGGTTINGFNFGGGSSTSAAFQLLFGVQLPVKSEHVARVEARFTFFTGTVTSILFNYSF